MKLTINVTKNDIKYAKGPSLRYCPIARAANRLKFFKDKNLLVYTTSLAWDGVRK